MNKGRLFLIPVPLGQTPVETVLPAHVLECARQLKHFVAENAKSARAFLKSLPSDTPLQQIEIHELNEHSSAKVLPELLAPLLAGVDVGLVSEAGCPAVADPGANLVALAHQEGIRELEKDSLQQKRTQIFIETPYRNQQMLNALIAGCAPHTKICLATDLTLPNESIITGTPAEWRRRATTIDRRPTVFLLQA